MNGVFDKKTKTIYIDTGGKHGKRSAVLGVIFLFLCVFAGVYGIISSVADSFNFELSTYWIAGQILLYLLFFTVVYFMPSFIFACVALLGGGAVIGFYVWRNLDEVIFRASAALNWCLFQINEAGYGIGPLLDRELARDTPHEYYAIIFTFAIIFFTGVFSYLIYSRKNVFFNLVISITVIFPGFFYGLIPSSFSFALITAFWVANFSVNIFDSEYIARLIYKQDEIPAKKLAKIKLKEFKREHRASIKSIKKEIKTIALLPHPDENILRLERLLRQLEVYAKPGFLFLKFYGLDKLKVRKSNQKFVNPVKSEKKKLKKELKEMEQAEKTAMLEERKAFKNLNLGERLKISFRYNFDGKRKFFTRSGFNAGFAFLVALLVIMLVQPFISSDARIDFLPRPDDVLTTLTTTVEHLLVGSDARIYGGHSGGMGGGNLYRPGGVRFRNVPILELDLRETPRIQSSMIYLRGFVGAIYDGRRWIEADRRYIDDFNRLMASAAFETYRPESFFRYFKSFMHDAMGASLRQRSNELTRDRITVQHVVTGGRLLFTPYFMENITLYGFNMRRIADLNTHVTNSIFRRPRYTMEFYSSDNILNRDLGYPVNNMRHYLNRYMDIFTHVNFWTHEQILERFPNARIINQAELTELLELYDYNGENFSDDYHTQIEHFLTSGGRHILSVPNYIIIPKEDGPTEYEFTEFIESYVWNSRSHFGSVPLDFIRSEMAYYNFVREHFLQLPETLPEAVGELAREITQGLDSVFDKALAIEYYLSTTFPYTLDPRTPRDLEQDFVYSFLFDVQEGYCSYYATAMTVMLRTLGIPAREVEGFLVDTRRITRDEDNNPAAIVVLDSDAHAWTEVYLRGIGWIPFEPTASAEAEEEEEQRPWVPPSHIRREGMNGFMEMPYWEVCDCWENDLDCYCWDDEGFIAGTADDIDYTNLYIAILTAASIALIISVFYFINYGINSKRLKYFKTAGTNAAMLKMLAYIMRFLKLCGFTIQSDEGLVNFARRISQNFPMMRSDGWVNLMRIMQKARYSVHNISEQEREYACSFIGELREECLKNLKFGLKFRLRFMRFVI